MIKLPIDSAHTFSFRQENNQDLNLVNFKGKVLLIVNTASRCWFTKQYTELQTLYERYQSQGLMVIAVPSNDFANQEPADNKEILQFCASNYHLTFPIVCKQHVIGKNAHPFYQWVKQQRGFLATPKWNFHKYLIDRQGRLVDYFYSTTSPHSPRFRQALEKLLVKE